MAICLLQNQIGLPYRLPICRRSVEMFSTNQRQAFRSSHVCEYCDTEIYVWQL